MKAANLLINNKGVLMIADFGLARPFSLPKSNAESHGEQPKHSAAEYTNMVVTRWYRPPELLLGETRYGPEIDMWGVGCVFGEMHHRKPILAGESDADQLSTIFRLCGSPDDTNFPGWFDLPGFDGQKKDWSQPTRQRQVMEWALRDG
jgi:serine/threonine-protein kinase BUR1